MPARKDRDGSITIRFRDSRYGDEGIEEIFPIKKLIDFFDSHSDQYVIGLEQPGLKSTQHYQCAIVLRDDARIADDFKKKLLRYIEDNIPFELSPEERERTLDCKYTNRIKYTIGYASKEYVAYIKGISPEYHNECIEFYNSNKLNEKQLPVSRSRFLPLIREMYDELWKQLAYDSERMDKFARLEDCKKFSVLEKMLISRGYDTSCVAPSQKREIIYNFQEYIVGNAESSTSDLGILDSF